MILRICLTLLGLLTLITFNGCCEKEIIFQDRIVKEMVPVKCIPKDVNCSLSGNNTEVIGGLLTCIVNLKESIKTCK